LPSMIATHELVVPRSMPMILPMVLLREVNSVGVRVAGQARAFKGPALTLAPPP
jgi:hypothetical protein